MQVLLFTTAGCHLCEQALDLLHSVRADHSFEVIEKEIGDDDSLIELYGVRIPVVQFEDGEEINWPFDEALLRQSIANKINH
ncbi:glutaredoxin family protein [Methylophaga sp.]|uniref:glutaredoxin family protein n=1 Tax=Methylophaga sp. TaxID=2024840 RepID=UPI003F6A4301